ncbi:MULTISPECIES: DUF5684 domain-containing protein [unclassified Fusobacterium]|uniref:DUF5684 domain-containing protein n=1 Tax=unclassified Fusobacterium TaxID=2648384 RepID=UPI0025C2D9AD|nr:DUF5684 domain-containing protein [Fusobacterium sp.]
MIGLIILIIVLAGMWKAFTKAGLQGWTSLIPIYNVYLMITVLAKLSWWYILLLIIPIVNFFVVIKININIAKNFKISSPVLFGLGLTFLGFIFYPILGFGNYDFATGDEAEIID